MASWRVNPAGFGGAHPRRAVAQVAAPEERPNLALALTFGSAASPLTPFGGQGQQPPVRSGAPCGPRLGELLVAEGLLTSDQLLEALAEQRLTSPKRPLGEILLARKLVPGAVLVGFLSSHLEVELEQEEGFGTGLRRAIADRHRSERTDTSYDEGGGEEDASQSSNVVALWHPQRRPAEGPDAARPRRLGELLIEAGLLTGGQLDQALAEQQDTGRMLGEILIDREYVPMITLVNLLSEQLNGSIEQEDGFGTGLRQLLEDKLLERRPSTTVAAARR
jgi:hypothetical protein